MRYLPPFRVIEEMLNLTTVRGRTRVDMTLEQAHDLIRALLQVVAVDEAFYLARNPDVAEGIREGNIRSAQQHFVHHGYFEGRAPGRIEVDEQWYLTQNEDVARTVKAGEHKSAQDHYDNFGWTEGRIPHPLVD